MRRFNIFQILTGIIFCMVAMGFTGCAKENSDGITPGGGEQNSEVFNFSTRSTYTLDVKYEVPADYLVYFEVYSENPISINEQGQEVKRTDIQPIEKGYTDGKGVYKKPIVINSAVETLYIYTPYIGVPELLKCNVENGVLTTPIACAKGGNEAMGVSSRGITRASTVSSDNTVNYPGIKTLTLGKWRHSDGPIVLSQVLPELGYSNRASVFGRPDYLYAAKPGIVPNDPVAEKPALEISADILKTIRTVLPGDNMGEVDPQVLKNGAINITKDAEIDLYLITDGGAYLNVLAYYCYPTGQAPTSASEIKAQMIAIPNAKNFGLHSQWGGTTEYGSMFMGEGVRLHYIDQNGVDQGTKFPQGTSISWILYSNGYKDKFVLLNGAPAAIGVPSVGNGAIYSDPKLMQNEIPHMAVFRHGDFVVTAFEDCIQTSVPKCDYDDVIFHVASTPADAITGGIPDKDPAPVPDVETDYRGILSFEDNWPYRGDFDMNDVVVKYTSKVTMNKNNEITKTVDTYTVVWSGATYNNSFAVENKNISTGNGTVTLEGGDGTAKREGNIIRAASSVLDYANQPEKKTLTVTTTFATPIAKENFVYPPYNPFITVKSEVSREVHMTNMAPTSNLDTKWLGFGHDFSKPEQGLYYITYNESGIQMPFAIDILFNSDEDMAGYVIPAETKPIHEYYPTFLKWLQSGGDSNKDWYLYPKK